MYQQYFGFSQAPFSIAPDPQFLYLGPRHREALAHLRHGLTSSGGFLLLTGEVGTGKTTVSRAVLQDLGDTLDLAFILNPRLSEHELLAAICDEFGITGLDAESSLKALTDAIREYLMAASSADRRPVVLIDEAQHLLPSVLEQLRLLTNLETNDRKLLSVLLIGQPELHQLLQQHQLRQVAQRIVARYQLQPLTVAETGHYIEHRLQVAGLTQAESVTLFPTAAQRQVYRDSQGTPRLINLLCDHALQETARAQAAVVSPAMVRRAAASLQLQVQQARPRRPQLYWPNWLSSSLGGIAAALLVFGWLWHSNWLSSTWFVDTRQLTAQPLEQATRQLAEQWQLGRVELGQQPCERLVRYQVGCVQRRLSLEQIAELGLPAVIELRGGEAGYAVVLQYANDTWRVQGATGEVSLSTEELARIYRGEALVYWSQPAALEAGGEILTDWLASRLSPLVPYSLQEAEVRQQLSWLQTHLGEPEGSEVSYYTLAYLSSQGQNRGPDLTAESSEEAF